MDSLPQSSAAPRDQYRVISDKDGLKLLEESSSGRLVFERLYSFCSSDADVFSAESYLDARVKLMQASEFNLRIVDYEIAEGKRSGVVRYEAFAQTLNKEFVEHVKSNWRWRERELVNTMRSALGGLRDLHGVGLTHGDLRMSAIVLSEGNQVKLADQFAINFMTISAPSYLRKDTKLLTATCALLPPEAILSLKKDSTVTTTQNADLWALGVILLEMVLLENVHSSLYDYKTIDINLVNLQKKIVKAKRLLTKKSRLLLLLEQLLSKDESERVKAYTFIEDTNSSSVLLKSVSFKDDSSTSSLNSSNCNSIGNIKSLESHSNQQSHSSKKQKSIINNQSKNQSDKQSNQISQSVSVISSSCSSNSNNQYEIIESKRSIQESSPPPPPPELTIENQINQTNNPTTAITLINNNGYQPIIPQKCDSKPQIIEASSQCLSSPSPQSSESSSVSQANQNNHNMLAGLFLEDDISSIASSTPVTNMFYQIVQDSSSQCNTSHSNQIVCLNALNTNTCSSFDIISIPPLEESEIHHTIIAASIKSGSKSNQQNPPIKQNIEQKQPQLQQYSAILPQDENIDCSNQQQEIRGSLEYHSKQSSEMLKGSRCFEKPAKGVFLLGQQKQYQYPPQQYLNLQMQRANSSQQVVAPMPRQHGIFQMKEQTKSSSELLSSSMSSDTEESNCSSENIDLKLQLLEDLCGQTLERSKRNREKMYSSLLLTTSEKHMNLQQSFEKKVPFSEISQTSSRVVTEIEEEQISSQHSSSQQQNQEEQYEQQQQQQQQSLHQQSYSTVGQSLLKQLQLLTDQLNATRSRSVNHHSFSQSFQQHSLSQSYTESNKQSAPQLSKEENLRLSAHYGSLALTHLFEYFQQQEQGANVNNNIGSDSQHEQAVKESLSLLSSPSSLAYNRKLVGRYQKEEDRTPIRDSKYSEHLLSCLFDDRESMTSYPNTSSNYLSSICCSHGFRGATTNSYITSCSNSITSLVGGERQQQQPQVQQKQQKHLQTATQKQLIQQLKQMGQQQSQQFGGSSIKMLNTQPSVRNVMTPSLSGITQRI